MLCLRSFLFLLLLAAIGCSDSSPGIQKPDNPAPLPDASARVGDEEDEPGTRQRIPLDPRQSGQ